MRKTFIVMMLIVFATNLNAQEAAANTYLSFGQIALVVNIALLIFAAFLILLLSNAIANLKRGISDNPNRLTWWERFIALKSEKTEAELDLHEDFDGITELDNPTPPWFNFIFYTTIIIGILYLLNYHVFETGLLQDEEYKKEVAEAEIAKEAYLKKAGNLIDENSVTLLTDAASLTEGNNIYTANCAVCHGKLGEGLVGPNLTDDYWMHGSSINDVFKTIKYGVPEKGMVPWQNSLNGKQIQDLSSYILSLKGTNPPNAKEPQGDKVE